MACLSPGPLAVSALVAGPLDLIHGRLDTWRESRTLHLPDPPDSISVLSHFAGVTIYV